jgi:hypothetical protein
MVRTARAPGRRGPRSGPALGSSKQAAWEAHTRWIEDQGHQHDRTGYEGLGPDASPRRATWPASRTPSRSVARSRPVGRWRCTATTSPG